MLASIIRPVTVDAKPHIVVSQLVSRVTELNRLFFCRHLFAPSMKAVATACHRTDGRTRGPLLLADCLSRLHIVHRQDNARESIT